MLLTHTHTTLLYIIQLSRYYICYRQCQTWPRLPIHIYLIITYIRACKRPSEGLLKRKRRTKQHYQDPPKKRTDNRRVLKSLSVTYYCSQTCNLFLRNKRDREFNPQQLKWTRQSKIALLYNISFSAVVMVMSRKWGGGLCHNTSSLVPTQPFCLSECTIQKMIIRMTPLYEIKSNLLAYLHYYPLIMQDTWTD